MSWFDDVLAFHRKFGLVIEPKPTWPDDDLLHLLTSLIAEELVELTHALNDRDEVGAADGIVDLIYVLIGMAITMGLDIREVWKVVQTANMAKDGGGRRADGKILKPDGWRPPDVAGALRRGCVDAVELDSGE